MRSCLLCKLLSCIALFLFVHGAPLQEARFNVTDASVILGYAQASYCQPGLQTWRCGPVCDSVPALSNVTVVNDSITGGLAYVGYDEAAETIVISFRGTVATNFLNWWSDLSSVQLVETELCQPRGCMVGKGFLQAYEGLREGVVNSVKSLRHAVPGAQITVTGHSLGAALATLCAMDLHSIDIAASKVFNYGCPRLGNSVMYEFYKTTVAGTKWRVTHARDPVIHLPTQTPWARNTSFWHTANEVFFKNENGLDHVVCDGSGEDSRCSHSEVALPTPRDHLRYLDRHLGSYGCD